ncbi:MAG: trypsin-like serine protease, partial [Cyanobacteria bacterium J06639_1]
MSRVARRPPAFYLLLAIALTGCTHDVSPSAIAPASVSTSRSTGSERVSLLFAPARDSVRLEDSAIALAASYLQTLPLGHENDAVLADAAQHLTGAELAIAPSLDLDRAKMSADVVAPTPISLADAATFVSALALASPTAEQLARRSSRLLGSEVLAEAIAMPVLPLEATGAIAGTAWQDTNANTEIDSGELLLSERIVFLDRNLDGTLDPDEASTITNADGRYQFDRLFPGTYAVSLQADSRMFPAIVGGTPSNPSDWPWMVAIVRADEPAFPGHICGATVVHSHWVLTAAHCLHRNITKLRQPEEIE